MFSLPTPSFFGYLAIPKAYVPSGEQLETVLTALDRLSSTEGQNLLNSGIAGVNYAVDGEYAVAIESEEADRVQSDVAAFSQLGTQSNGYTAYSAKPGRDADEALDRTRN